MKKDEMVEQAKIDYHCHIVNVEKELADALQRIIEIAYNNSDKLRGCKGQKKVKKT